MQLLCTCTYRTMYIFLADIKENIASAQSVRLFLNCSSMDGTLFTVFFFHSLSSFSHLILLLTVLHATLSHSLIFFQYAPFSYSHYTFLTLSVFFPFSSHCPFSIIPHYLFSAPLSLHFLLFFLNIPSIFFHA